MANLDDLLAILVKFKGSDLYLTVGAPPAAKFQGKLKAIAKERLTEEEAKSIAYSLMTPNQIADFEKRPEMNLAIVRQGMGRFRVNIFKQQNYVALVIRSIITLIPSLEELNLPPILKEIIMERRGLILFVGSTGSGKSTSLASLIDYRNINVAGHIITIEDPIEYVHTHKKSIVNQREVGVDTESYEDALKNTLRQAPDVILIGEIRDAKTMEHALTFAETGHLCLSTLHANNANQALDRIINFFPEERHRQIFMDLSLNVRAFISQRLVPTLDEGRIAAVEVLLASPIARDLIRKGEVYGLKEVMEKGVNIGMKTFDQALLELYQSGRVSLEEALRNADSANNLRLKINLAQSEGKYVVQEVEAEDADEFDGEGDGALNPAEIAAAKVRKIVLPDGTELSLESIDDEEDEPAKGMFRAAPRSS